MVPWRSIARSRITPWVIIGIFVLGLLGWGLSALVGSHPDYETRRWQKIDPVRTTGLFRDLLKSSPAVASPRPPPDWGATNVAVYSVPALKPSRPHPTLRDLGGSGQAHAIDYLAQNSKAAPHSWADLRSALMDESEPASDSHDPFRFDRVLVATVTKGADWEPGDRMVWMRVFVQPINFVFAGYTVAATENETVKLTSIEDTRTRKLSAGIDLTIPALGGPKASLGPSAERTLKTSTDITAQYERLGIDIMPSFLRIIREAETGGDVLGNTTVALSVLTDPATILKKDPGDKKSARTDHVVLLVTDEHLDDGPKDLDPADASLTVLPEAPLPHCALRAKVWMLYEQRSIVAGREYYDESRQDVSLVRDAVAPKEAEIVSADDVSPAVWSIDIVPNARMPEQKEESLGARVGDAPWRDLVFTDYGLAIRLARWIRTHPGKGVQQLTFNYPPGASMVPIKQNDDDCTSEGHRAGPKGLYRAQVGL